MKFLLVSLFLFPLVSIPMAVSNSFFERTNTVRGLEIIEITNPAMCKVDKIEIQCSYLLFLKEKVDNEVLKKKYRDDTYSPVI